MGVGFPMKDSSPAGIKVEDFGKDSPSLSSLEQRCHAERSEASRLASALSHKNTEQDPSLRSAETRRVSHFDSPSLALSS
jgi:hypothetical protein